VTRGEWARMTALVFGSLLACCAGWSGLRAQMPPKAGGSYRIAGTVVDGASGKPLALTEVTIGLIEGKSLRETYATGADGRFSFEGLPAGKYQVSAKRRGYVAQSYKGHDDYWAAIVVGPGQNSDDVRFAMTAGASITGHVFDERGDAVRQGTVLLLREISSGGRRRLTRSHSAELNDLGGYRFWHLEPGAYVVAVIAQPWYAELYGIESTATDVGPGDIDTDVVYPVTFYPGAMDADAAGRITLTTGESVTADVALAPTEARRVTVQNDGDDPTVRPQIVWAVQYITDGITEALSTYVFPGLDAVTIVGLPPNRVDVSWKTTGKNAQEHFKSLNLSDRNTGSLSAATVIRGVIEGVGGAKLAGTTVKLGFDGGKKTYSAVVGAKGEFEFREELVRGLYTIEVPQLADMQLGIRAKGAEFFEGSVAIQPGRDVELKITAGRGARVRGRAVKNGAGAEGVLVALVPEKFEDANDLMRVGESDSSGAFELEKVVSGRYRLIAVEDGWDADWRSVEFLKKFVERGKDVEIGAGAVVTEEIETAK
jgi:Carboxypeptidase regulatory-like domain